MGVRVRLEICFKEKCVRTNALVNSGYEASENELAIPLDLAKELGVWPMDELIVDEAFTAGGYTPVYVVKEKALVKLLINDRSVEDIACTLIVNPYIDEPLISDHLIDSLGIIVVSFSRGLWRHRSDPVDVVRESSI